MKSAEEKIAGATSWKQTYTFDRYGNRRFDTNLDANQNKLTTTLDSTCTTAVCNPTIDPLTNKLIGYTFDNAGNTKVDANGRTFTYDAENKQTKVVSGGNVIGEYFYDGDGKRVKKKVNGEETIFVYNASGQLVAEYTNQTPQNAPKVSYLTSDHLGSPRITTDVRGDVYTRRDFMPYGEEIESKHTSSRSAGLNYAVDEIREKFATYERDNETELDFAQARMHNYNLGRFTTPDPHKIVLETSLEEDEEKAEKRLRSYIGKPEQWNKYTYAINNPLKFVDPDGREIRLNPNLTEKERNKILYHLQKLTRDELNWKTDDKGNIVIVATKTKGAKGKNEGTRLLRRMIGYNSVTTINLRVAPGGSQESLNSTNASNGVGSDSIVGINLTDKRVYGTFDENTGISRQQDTPVWITLAHELIHADHAARGTMHQYVDPVKNPLLLGAYQYKDASGKTQTAMEQKRELATVGIGGYNNKMDITENQIRREQNLRTRVEY